MQRLSLLVLTLGHFCVDSYGTMVIPALPFLSERMGFGLAFSGILAAIPSVCSVSQPLLGLWADRMKRRYLMLGGLFLAAAFTPLMGITSSYWMLVALLCLGGFGVAAFHPQVFAVVGQLSGSRRSFGIALFIFGGTMALGSSPLWVSWLGSGPGLHYLPLVALPGLLLLFGQLPPRPHCQNTHHQPDPQAGGGGWRGRLTLANHESQSFQSCGHQDQRDRKVKKERVKPPDEYLKTGH